MIPENWKNCKNDLVLNVNFLTDVWLRLFFGYFRSFLEKSEKKTVGCSHVGKLVVLEKKVPIYQETLECVEKFSVFHC